eukprot:TRINITY_DN15522_c0_g1_i1.p1 TRINITY_DN15522_c0_g1~~TRINITY_DN15522_c0_g1_i1.p1  ORF type:complete len:527 (+),score=71.75 TRINITY_DN15522_c0_g1_i1:31-1581(+)
MAAAFPRVLHAAVGTVVAVGATASAATAPLLLRCEISAQEAVPAAGGGCERVVDNDVFADVAVEDCAARALSALTARRTAGLSPAFHVGGGRGDGSWLRCVVELCSLQQRPRAPDGSSRWHMFAPRELCPNAGGSPLVIAEVVPTEDPAAEFSRVFGPMKLHREQELRGIRGECTAEAHRLVAEVCVRGAAGGCDEWSKYTLPRCHVFLGTPYDPLQSNFLYAPTCERTGQFLCPPSVPIALRVVLKAGSRSAAVWAAMLEGLIPSLVAARRTLTASFAEGSDGSGGESRVSRYVTDWLAHEEMRLGCNSEAALFSVSRALHRLADEAYVGLPLAMCPTCCRSAAGRLRVFFVRSPFARLHSFYHGYWRPTKGHLLPADTGFPAWVEMILGPYAVANSSLFETADLDHVKPAFSRPLDEEVGELGRGPYVVFSIDEVSASLRRVEEALCAPPFLYCQPLPAFPERHVQEEPRARHDLAGASPNRAALAEAELPQTVVAMAYVRHPYAVLGVAFSSR